MTNILDIIIDQAIDNDLTIKYISMSESLMADLILEMSSALGKFEVDTLIAYKDIPLKEKVTDGFQVVYI